MTLTVYYNFFWKVINEFNKEKINYCILRNYEFLLDSNQEVETHLDLVIAKEDMKKAHIILKNFGGVKYGPQFSLKHQGGGIYLKDQKIKIGFDIQNNGVYWNDIVYLTADIILPRRKKEGELYVLSDEDACVMYLCHSILGKRMFKQKYKQILKYLITKKLDKNYLFAKLTAIFNQKIAKSLLKALYRKDFVFIENRMHLYVAHFLLRRPKDWLPFMGLFWRWFSNPKYCPLQHIPLIRFFAPSAPLISFIGPDGSGKSTMAKNLVKSLDEMRGAKLVYTGRGNSNLLPIRRFGDIYKKREICKDALKKNTPNKRILRQILYSIMAPIYTLDLLLRYFFVILPKRKKQIFVVTDRYCSDILIMKYVPFWIKKILLSLFPKPTITFYLYNDSKILYDRRRSQSISELERQMKLFSYLETKFSTISIKTEDIENDFSKILEQVMLEIMKNGY